MKRKTTVKTIIILFLIFIFVISCTQFYQKEMEGELDYKKEDAFDLTHKISYLRSDQKMKITSEKLGETEGLIVFVENTLINNHPSNSIFINELKFYMYNSQEVNIWTISEEVNKLLEPGEKIEVSMKETVPTMLIKDFKNLGGGINYQDDWPDIPDDDTE